MLLWIQGSYAPTLSENGGLFSRLLKNKAFKEEKMTKVGLYPSGDSTTLESNKSQCVHCRERATEGMWYETCWR
jgi:hypothetical protein